MLSKDASPFVDKLGIGIFTTSEMAISYDIPQVRQHCGTLF